jgi:hypothetical protein
MAVAMFAGMCNLLSWVFENYQLSYLERHQFIWSYLSIVGEGISLAPLFVLIIFRRSLPIVLIYASMLFLILIWTANYLRHFIFDARPPFIKIYEQGLLLFF